MQMPLETLFQEAKVTMARFMCQQNLKLFPPRIFLGSLNTLNQCSAIIIPILQISKLELWEAKQFAHNYKKYMVS